MLKCLIVVFLLGKVVVAAAPDTTPKCNDKEIRWTGFGDIDWPSHTMRIVYGNSGRYIPENGVASRLATYKDDIFLGFPRYKRGSPMTLAKVNLKTKNCQTILSPFPNFDLQQEGNCSALQSVTDIFIDPYGILWALDIGITNFLEDTEETFECSPKIVAINVRTGKVVTQLDIGSLTNDVSRLQYLTVDYSREGRAYVYVSDAANRAILVFEVSSGRGYRMILPKDVSLNSGSNDSDVDVLYLALVRPTGENQNRLVFSYLSSKLLFSIKTVHLQKGTAKGKIEEIGIKERFVFLGTDNVNQLYFRREDEPNVYAWNVFDILKPLKMIYQGNVTTLPTQLVANKRGRVWLLESNFPDYFRGKQGLGVEHAIKLIS